MDVHEIAARVAPEAERERRLPDELVEAMIDSGLFRLCLPRSLGGLEAHPSEMVDAVESLARADGAAGWCAAIGTTSGLLAAYLPADSAREVYQPPRVVSGGVFAPRGRAVPVDGGYSVSGVWPFASGCRHCDWLMGGCFVEGASQPVPTLMLAPAREVEIHDTWHSMGLRGTGSHDMEMRDVFVPADRAASLVAHEPVADGPLYAFPVFGLLALAIGAVCLGIAGGALNDVVLLAGSRKPTGSSRTMAERPPVQAAVAELTASLGAARALLGEAISNAWESAQAGGVVPDAEKAGLRIAATHAASTGASVTGAAYRLAGGAAVYETRSPLPRRFRDAWTATQHMLVAPATNELAGRLLLGLPTDTSQL